MSSVTVLMAQLDSNLALIIRAPVPLSEAQWIRIRRAMPVFNISKNSVERLRLEGFSAAIVPYKSCE